MGFFGDEFALELFLFFVKYLLTQIPISNHNNNPIYLQSWTFVQLLLGGRKGGGGSRERGEGEGGRKAGKEELQNIHQWPKDLPTGPTS